VETQEVLHWNDRRVGRGHPRVTDEVPMDITSVRTEIFEQHGLLLACVALRPEARRRARALEPALRRVVVVRAGVNDAVLREMLRAIARRAGIGAESEVEHL